ncbi:phage tail assembly chaperone [Nitrospirillum iridis]|uniref:phage tail assembly chaperone n=1 Tax=Nitrospirillum iridis TaxID=765888 RepID=UPI00161A6CB4
MKTFIVYDTASGDFRWLVRALACQSEAVTPLGLSCVEFTGTDEPGPQHRLVDGAWVLRPQADLDADALSTAWHALRAERFRRLASSDIEVAGDRWQLMTPARQEAWATYRQALRDLPETCTDPFNPIWPLSP